MTEPSSLTKYSIQQLINNGNLVFIASGRFKGDLPRVINELNLSGYILSNGAYIEYHNFVIYKKIFDPELFDKLSKYCDENDCLFTGETQELLYSPRINERFTSFLKNGN